MQSLARRGSPSLLTDLLTHSLTYLLAHSLTHSLGQERLAKLDVIIAGDDVTARQTTLTLGRSHELDTKIHTTKIHTTRPHKADHQEMHLATISR